jgi:hypothetical protein
VPGLPISLARLLFLALPKAWSAYRLPPILGKLKTFTVADYNTLFAKLAADANYTRVSYSKINDTDKSATVHFTTALDLGGLCQDHLW